MSEHVRDRKTISVVICMGSSCFARGNNRNIELLQSFADRPDPAVRVEPRGHLCEGLCRSGPNIVIDGRLHHEVDPVALAGLLNQATGGPAGPGGAA